MDEPCPTIRAFTEGGHTHWADVIDFRKDLIVKQVTSEATALLQSFPTSYQFPESKTLTQQIIGNAVPPLLAKELGLAILKSIK
jgi:site-specific DNA-cytosine methylase